MVYRDNPLPCKPIWYAHIVSRRLLLWGHVLQNMTPSYMIKH